MVKSRYKYEVIDSVLCIEDLDVEGTMSVTNNIENVLNEIMDNGVIISNKLIIYRDSDGIWDGINCNGRNKPINFYPLGCNTKEEAIKKLESLWSEHGSQH